MEQHSQHLQAPSLSCCAALDIVRPNEILGEEIFKVECFRVKRS